MEQQSETVCRLLQEAEFFPLLSPDDLTKVAEIGRVESLAAGTVLFQEGDPCEQLYLVCSGLVGLEMCVPRQGCLRIMTVGRGEFVGWSALFEDGRMTARATLVEPAVLIFLPTSGLKQLCEADHDIGYAVMKDASAGLLRRLLATRLQLLDLFHETQPKPPLPLKQTTHKP